MDREEEGEVLTHSQEEGTLRSRIRKDTQIKGIALQETNGSYDGESSQTQIISRSRFAT